MRGAFSFQKRSNGVEYIGMNHFLKRRATIVVLAAMVIGGAGFAYFSRDKAPTYEFTVAQRRDVIAEVNVTGRVKPVESIDLSFNLSGKVVLAPFDVGDKVSQGQTLIQLDVRDAQKDIKDAEIELANAKLALDRINLQHEQQLRGDVLNKSYEEGVGILASLYGEFVATLDALDLIFFDTNLSKDSRQTNIEFYASYDDKLAGVPARLERLYRETQDLYRIGLKDYQLAERGNGETRNKAIQSGYELAIKTAEMIKTGRDAVRFLQDKLFVSNSVHIKQVTIDSQSDDLAQYAATMDEYVQDLLQATNAIDEQLDEIEAYPIERDSQELIIAQRENDLKAARDAFEDHFMYAPMNGVVTKRLAKVGEIVSANTIVISLISEAKFEIEANVPEADIAKVEVGNIASVTLDAYGRDTVFETNVVSVNPAETIIEGVATYKVTFQFAKYDVGVKSGMTANIDIASGKREGVIAIPQRALIRKEGSTFVQILDGENIREVMVSPGLRGSDGSIEIISGVNEGDKVITLYAAD